jgi:hypothetical protein
LTSRWVAPRSPSLSLVKRALDVHDALCHETPEQVQVALAKLRTAIDTIEQTIAREANDG